MLGSLAVEGTLKGAATVALAVPVLILGLPVMEIVCSVVRRFRNGVPVYQADQGHLHHRLLNLGLSQRQAVLLLYGWAFAFGSLGVWLVTAPPALATGLAVVFLGILFLLAGRWGWTGRGKGSHEQRKHYL
jgi:UDP-GlcNAc:undecaprenyl-phosphate GlcNAc-1-phosphate transferase